MAMKNHRRLTLLSFTLSTVSLAMFSIRCRPSPDFEALKREILNLHQQTIDAHMKKDTGFFSRHMADGYFAVKDGEVRHPSRQDVASEYERYLATTAFTEYRDMREPIVGFSKDGSVAWSIVQVKVAGRDRAESGQEKDFDLTWAWITLYGRKGDRWIWLGESSSFKRGH
jgi:hypothetical protein